MNAKFAETPEFHTQPIVAFTHGLTHGNERLQDRAIMAAARFIGRYETDLLLNNWFEPIPYAEVLDRDTELARGDYDAKGKLVIVGYSAGASHGANIFGRLAEELDDVYFIGLCGRLAKGALSKRDYRTMGWAAHEKRAKPSPMFTEAIDYFEDTTLPLLNSGGRRGRDLKKQMYLVHQLFDPVVPRQTMLIEGVAARGRRVVGHGPGILAGSLLVPRIIKHQFNLQK